MDDNDEAIGLARLGATADAGTKPQHQWLLLIPLLALGYGFYTQLDRIRAMLTPEPVVEVRPAPIAEPEASLEVAVAMPPSTVSQVHEPVAEPERPVAAASIPASPAQAAPEVRELFPVPSPPSEPARRPGKAGLVQALRNGEIRLGTAGDLGRWKTSYTRASGRGLGRYFDERTGNMDVYIVRQDFEVPADLAGANAVVFVLDAHAPFPRGDTGHSPILDIDSGACVGTTCRLLLSDD